MIVGKIHGLNEVVSNINKHVQTTLKKRDRALKRTGLLLQRYSQQVVPIDTSVLKNSAFTRLISPNLVRVGYTASYAVFVHERLDLRHEKGKQAKFLEEPARLRRTELLTMFKNSLQS